MPGLAANVRQILSQHNTLPFSFSKNPFSVNLGKLLPCASVLVVIHHWHPTCHQSYKNDKQATVTSNTSLQIFILTFLPIAVGNIPSG